MSSKSTLTVLMSTGGDGEADEPVAVYADSGQARQAAEDFNVQFQPYVEEPAWQYTRAVPFIKA